MVAGLHVWQVLLQVPQGSGCCWGVLFDTPLQHHLDIRESSTAFASILIQHETVGGRSTPPNLRPWPSVWKRVNCLWVRSETVFDILELGLYAQRMKIDQLMLFVLKIWSETMFGGGGGGSTIRLKIYWFILVLKPLKWLLLCTVICRRSTHSFRSSYLCCSGCPPSSPSCRLCPDCRCLQRSQSCNNSAAQTRQSTCISGGQVHF